MKTWLITALMGLCLFTVPSAKADAMLPFESAYKGVYLRVEVAGKPLWFIVDTGDKYAVIDLSVAKSLGLALGNPIPISGGGKATVTGALLNGAAFTIPSAQGFSQPLFLALPLTELTKHSGHEIDGIIGYDFLSQFIVDIDYVDRTFTLHDKDAWHYGGSGESLPITFNAASHPLVHGQIVDGSAAIDGTFTFDIGSGAALILNSPFVASQGYLKTARPTVNFIEGLGIGGGVEGQVGRVSAFRLGSFLIQNPVAVFTRTSAGAFAGSNEQGNVGGAIIEKFRVILDYAHSRIVLEPNSKFADPIAYNRTGFVLLTSLDFKTYSIGAVADDSPAFESGLRIGDVIVSVDGHPATDRTLSDLQVFFQKVTSVALTVRRGDRTFDVTLKPRDRI